MGETLNDDELIELMHNAHIINNTETNENFNFDEFYNIITKKNNWEIDLKSYRLIILLYIKFSKDKKNSNFWYYIWLCLDFQISFPSVF